MAKGATTLQKLGGGGRDLRTKPESRAKPEKERGRDLGMGLVSPSPKFVEKFE